MTGDMGEIFNEHKKQRKEKRASNRKSSAEILRENGVSFESKNGGSHLIVGDYDFWPGTGLFIHRKSGLRGRGINNLLHQVGWRGKSFIGR